MPAFSSEERQLLHDSIDQYFSHRYGFEHAMQLARSDGPDGFGREEWADYARLGWLGLALPETAGGSGGGLTEAGILFAAAGRHLAQEPLLPTLILAAGAVDQLGTTEQKALLAEVTAGTRLMSFLHAEPDSGFARDHVAAVARRQGEGWSLAGEKAFALGAHTADTLIVSARIEDAAGPVGLFLVKRETPGVALVPAPAIDGRRGALAYFDDATLEDGTLLGETPKDRLAAIDRLLDRGALAVCAEAAGAMAAVTEMTTEYIKGRKQFGRSLSDFQVLQHRAVDMQMLSEETRVAVHAALTRVDEEAPAAARAVWRAKVQTARAARFVGGQGIQLHGGMGMTDEMAVGHYYKRLSMCEAMFGDTEWHLARLADFEPARAAEA